MPTCIALLTTQVHTGLFFYIPRDYLFGSTGRYCSRYNSRKAANCFTHEPHIKWTKSVGILVSEYHLQFPNTTRQFPNTTVTHIKYDILCDCVIFTPDSNVFAKTRVSLLSHLLAHGLWLFQLQAVNAASMRLTFWFLDQQIFFQSSWVKCSLNQIW